MKVRIYKDEWYVNQLYELDSEEEGEATVYTEFGIVGEITEVDLVHYDRIMEEFDKLQRWLGSVKEIENESANV